MLNNKGQSLVLFILMIPIFLGIFAFVIDVGNVIYQKNETDNMIEFVLDYGLNLQLEEELTDIPSELKETSILQEESKNLEDNKDLKNSDEQKNELTGTELEKLQKLLDYNLETCDNEIIIKNNFIVITSKKEVNGFFSNIFGFYKFKIESKYEGYLAGDK